MTAQTKSNQDRVYIFDTTLRDGEQCPGATMTHEEKLEVAELLDQMGVDIIEAGFPIASEGDFAAVNAVMASHFATPYPARSTVQVAALPRGASVEVEAIMVLRS